MQIEISIGSRFVIYDKHFEVVDSDSSTAPDKCKKCALKNVKLPCYYLACLGINRHDKKDVYFKKVNP